MARQVLPTNFKDDVLADSMDGKRRYILTENADGTFSLEDATTYTQVGDVFGQARLNAICKAINESVDQAKVVDDIDDIKAITQPGYVPGTPPLKQVISDLSFPDDVGFYPDVQDGVRGYNTDRARGADTFVPFRSGAEYVTSEAQEKYSSGSLAFPGDYSQCYLVVSISRLGTVTHLTNPVISNESATFEELYSNVHKNSQNTAGDVGHRTLVFKFQNVKKGDVFSFDYTARSKGHVSLFA